MARGRIKKGSTFVDMTAMCDVAFLLLTFFILVGKFKPAEAISVEPPSSVSNKVAPENDYFMVTIDDENKVFLSMDDKLKADVLEQVGRITNTQFTDAEIAAFQSSSFVGVPLSQLTKFISLSPEDQGKVTLTGVPYDSTNNELLSWITAAVQVSQGKTTKFLIKADGSAMYVTFKEAIQAFKKNEIFKYNLVTNAAEVPQGSELWKKNIAGLMGLDQDDD